MRYFGSKASTVDQVYELISSRVPAGTFCDPFGGIGIIGSYFKRKGYSVWCGDILTFAHYFQIARVQINTEIDFSWLCEALNLKSLIEVVELLNAEKPKNDWFVREYAEKRHFFTKENAVKIEACRLLIAEWSEKRWLDQIERAVLLASLINSMDKVANTAGTYYAYLKTWHRKAIRPFSFEMVLPTPGNPNCHSFLFEAKKLVALREFDILYLDPPYNERNYARYYHLPETIAVGGTPEVRGKSGIPDSLDLSSDFNKPGQANKALQDLLRTAKFRLLALHYSDSGLTKPRDIRDILACYGEVEEHILESKGYTTTRISRTVKQRLYLVSHG